MSSPAHLRRALAAWAGAVLLFLSTTLVASAPAVAHDELESTTPADGEEVTAAQELVLTFSGDLAEVGDQVVVTGPEGPATDGKPRIDGRDLHQPLLQDLPAGDYSVTWRVTSSDGHPISGQYGFTVVAASLSSTSSPTTTTEPTTTTSPTTAPTTTAQPAPSTSPSPSASPTKPATGGQVDDSGGISTPVLLGLGVLLLAAVAGVIVTVGRGRDGQGG